MLDVVLPERALGSTALTLVLVIGDRPARRACDVAAADRRHRRHRVRAHAGLPGHAPVRARRDERRQLGRHLDRRPRCSPRCSTCSSRSPRSSWPERSTCASGSRSASRGDHVSVFGPTLGTRSASERRLGPRFIVFGLLVMLAVSGLGLRLFQLQVAQAAVYQNQSEKRQTLEQPIPVARGLIYDRQRPPLVKNVPTFVLRVLPAGAARSSNAAASPTRLARLLGRADLHDHRASRRPHRLAVRARPDRRRAHRDRARHRGGPDQFPGVHVDLEARREYLQGTLMSHVLGGPAASPDPSTSACATTATGPRTSSARPDWKPRARTSCGAVRPSRRSSSTATATSSTLAEGHRRAHRRVARSS